MLQTTWQPDNTPIKVEFTGRCVLGRPDLAFAFLTCGALQITVDLRTLPILEAAVAEARKLLDAEPNDA